MSPSELSLSAESRPDDKSARTAAQWPAIPHQNRTPKVKFDWISSADLAALPDDEYLIEDVLVAGQPCVIAAARKTLKTSISIDAGISLATGRRFLGHFDVASPVRVGIMSGESGAATIKESAIRIARSKDISLRDIPSENLFWSFRLPHLSENEHLAILRQDVVARKLQVLVIDPAYLAIDLGDGAGNLFSVGRKLAPLSEQGRDTNCTIVIVHHNTKASGREFGAPELDDIAWSGFAEWARQWLLLGRREPFDPESSGVHKLWMSVGGSAGHSGRWAVEIVEGKKIDSAGRRWQVTIESANKAQRNTEYERERNRESVKQQKEHVQAKKNIAKLLDVLQKHPDGETKSTLRQLAGLNDGAFVRAVQSLVDDRMAEACTIKKRSNYDGYRLTQTARTSPKQSSQSG